ncbi:DUF411 domain-containing protein [Halomonas caseinilytica]|uniref:Uncharacterized conserved protein n=1 Tax=Halomonas caseinilytica TaxID=438744 RepID=A0A1M6UXA9_9GAMM|nr:DUF411 domain-containing protein [Halomonas caseinilytica]SEN36529.1 Uncharacterized conserved protein [Halomonas caseinilytica]SHK73745.1 Uncharacterized conserved protein [Halomonas caseinilytica]
MNRRIASLMLSTALLAGPSLAHAALPDAATLYKNPQCGCCDDYARHLEEMGVDVTIVDGADLNEIKSAAGVPYGLGACHTIEMGSYWIEGHVPMEALEALYEQRPDADGIGLAGMPIGTPGMPGQKQGDWDVYRFTDGESAPFMTL